VTSVRVGFDIGATKYAVLVEGPTGTRAHTAPSHDWNAEPVEHGAAWIRSALDGVLVAGETVEALAVGAQGIDRADVADGLAALLRQSGIPRVVCVNDGSLLVPAAGLHAGIGLIAGTGAIGNGTDAAGGTLLAGGWGAVIGDDAGAAGIVREAAKAALLAHDDGLPDDGLLAELLAAFGVGDAERLARAVNDEPTTANWGPRAPAVFAAALAGSALAARVIDGAAEHLVRLVTQLRNRNALGSDVVAGGSVVASQPLLADAVRSRLALRHPELTFQVLAGEPVDGALELARRL
jgi:N-acetylglucosamine kinase-like BadF-type ATPase